MPDHVQVDPEELRAHASSLRTIHERFAAVKEASGHIFQADEAYGQLCQWLPPILEGRHVAQDELVDELAFNVDALAGAVEGCADDYEATDDDNAGDFGDASDEL
ncbi:type VII secretion target [Glycomyces xiaoerkulensis]|uniref:type VII secretion target n=1 Tax=Glycomyces xiaoerkulensis TaxID=2038139 RepID=UPI0018E4182F|nr:type VII secretion target [Glycomyces xiaoerkulensis]